MPDVASQLSFSLCLKQARTSENMPHVVSQLSFSLCLKQARISEDIHVTSLYLFGLHLQPMKILEYVQNVIISIFLCGLDLEQATMSEDFHNVTSLFLLCQKSTKNIRRHL